MPTLEHWIESPAPGIALGLLRNPKLKYLKISIYLDEFCIDRHKMKNSGYNQCEKHQRT